MNNIKVRNNINKIGQGQQVILLAHGFGCDQQMWKYLSPNFLNDYTLVLFDYVGSGQSDVSAYTSEKYNSLKGYAQDVIDVIEALQLENIIFIGHSISSMIGMLAAIEKPHYFSKIIMIGPSPCYLNDGMYNGGFERKDIDDLLETMEMNFAGWASYMAPMAMDQPSDSHLTRDLEHSFASSNPRIAKEFAEVTFFSDCRNEVKSLQVPTLIIQCSNDSIVPVEVGYFLHYHIENSELVVMDTRGHYPHVSEPQKTVEIIHRFLNKA